MIYAVIDTNVFISALLSKKTDTATVKTERKTAIKMIKKGKMSLEEIAEYVPSLSIDELKELEAEVLQFA